MTREDIAIANRLAHEVLGRCLDELPPQTRRLLGLIEAMVTARVRRAGDRRGATCASAAARCARRRGWGDTQLRSTSTGWSSSSTVLVHRGGRGQSFVYELLYDGEGKDGRPLPRRARRRRVRRDYDGDLAGSGG